jgi:hypothetical protein
MAKITRMRPTDLKEMRDLLAALKALPGYAPHNPNATAAALEATLTRWDTHNLVEVQRENEAAAAQDATAGVEGELRTLRPLIHTQVAAQYGKDSDELASTGLKKASEYKKRGPKADRRRRSPEPLCAPSLRYGRGTRAGFSLLAVTAGRFSRPMRSAGRRRQALRWCPSHKSIPAPSLATGKGRAVQ